MTEETKKRGRKAKPKYEVVCDQNAHLDSIGFEMDWLGNLASQYDFDKFEYLHKPMGHSRVIFKTCYSITTGKVFTTVQNP